jgi:hypothetical protein
MVVVVLVMSVTRKIFEWCNETVQERESQTIALGERFFLHKSGECK